MSELIDPNNQATELGKVAVQESVSQGLNYWTTFLQGHIESRHLIGISNPFRMMKG